MERARAVTLPNNGDRGEIKYSTRVRTSPYAFEIREDSPCRLRDDLDSEHSLDDPYSDPIDLARLFSSEVSDGDESRP